MNKILRNKLTTQQLDWAKSEYMNYRPVSEIARSLSVGRTTIQHHVNEVWKSERNLRRTETASEFTEAKSALMNSTFSCSFKGLNSWVKKVTDSGYEMRPHEARTLMNIITEMDKITRLDMGSPTDIISETAPIDVIEIRKQIMANDPFMIEEVEFTEVKSEKTDSKDDKGAVS